MAKHYSPTLVIIVDNILLECDCADAPETGGAPGLARQEYQLW
jgi:hypothetical protein